MSLLLNQLDPWIAPLVLESITCIHLDSSPCAKGRDDYSPDFNDVSTNRTKQPNKLCQVIHEPSRVRYRSCLGSPESILWHMVVSDGRRTISLFFPSDTYLDHSLSVGCIVKLENWIVSTVQLLFPRSSYLDKAFGERNTKFRIPHMHGPLCLYIPQTHGHISSISVPMIIHRNPKDIHLDIDIRCAFEAMSRVTLNNNLMRTNSVYRNEEGKYVEMPHFYLPQHRYESDQCPIATNVEVTAATGMEEIGYHVSTVQIQENKEGLRLNPKDDESIVGISDMLSLDTSDAFARYDSDDGAGTRTHNTNSSGTSTHDSDSDYTGQYEMVHGEPSQFLAKRSVGKVIANTGYSRIVQRGQPLSKSSRVLEQVDVTDDYFVDDVKSILPALTRGKRVTDQITFL